MNVRRTRPPWKLRLRAAHACLRGDLDYNDSGGQAERMSFAEAIGTLFAWQEQNPNPPTNFRVGWKEATERYAKRYASMYEP